MEDISLQSRVTHNRFPYAMSPQRIHLVNQVFLPDIQPDHEGLYL